MIKIAIVTGSRAEWGLLKPLVEELGQIEDLDEEMFRIILFVTGSHLSPHFGMNVHQIHNDLVPKKKVSAIKHVEILLASVSAVGVSKSISLAVSSFAEQFNHICADLVVLLGDRSEMLSAAIAAFNANIPIAHIHGGETTRGSLDDAYRNSITHMSQLHFTAHEQYTQKVISLGKKPETVFTVGCLGLQNLPKPIKPKKQKQVILLYHSETANLDSVYQRSDDLITAIEDGLKQNKFDKIYAIGSNADPGGVYIDTHLVKLADKNEQVIFFPTLERNDFLGLLNESFAIIGNSSCGIYEAPTLGTATINVGNRQDGRLQASSVIDCNGTPQSIEAALDTLYSEEFRESLKDIKTPYRGGDVTRYIKKEIKQYFNEKEKNLS